MGNRRLLHRSKRRLRVFVAEGKAILPALAEPLSRSTTPIAPCPPNDEDRIESITLTIRSSDNLTDLYFSVIGDVTDDPLSPGVIGVNRSIQLVFVSYPRKICFTFVDISQQHLAENHRSAVGCEDSFAPK